MPESVQAGRPGNIKPHKSTELDKLAWPRVGNLGVLLGGLGSSTFCTFLLAKVADGPLSKQTRGFDKRILSIANDVRHKNYPPIQRTMSILSAAGEPWALYPVTGLMAIKWLREERPQDSATLWIALLGSAGINQALKRAVHRPRPFFKLPPARSGSSGPSFPSNHATMSLATYGTVAYLIASRKRATKASGRKSPKAIPQSGSTGSKGRSTRRSGIRKAARTWVPIVVLCGLIGWSRVYQGVHNPSDVVGGWIAGGIWLATCTRFSRFTSAPRT